MKNDIILGEWDLFINDDNEYDLIYLDPPFFTQRIHKMEKEKINQLNDIMFECENILKKWTGNDGVYQNQVIDDIEGKPIIVQFVCLSNLLASQKSISRDASRALLKECANMLVGYTLGKVSDDDITLVMHVLCDNLHLEFV